MDNDGSSPPIAPALRTHTDRMQQRRRIRGSVDQFLHQYWTSLLVDAYPVAEAILERALGETAVRRTLTV